MAAEALLLLAKRTQKATEGLNGKERLAAAAMAYIVASAEPRLFRLAFSRFGSDSRAEVDGIPDSFEQLRIAVAGVQTDPGKPVETDRLSLAWAVAHGVASAIQQRHVEEERSARRRRTADGVQGHRTGEVTPSPDGNLQSACGDRVGHDSVSHRLLKRHDEKTIRMSNGLCTVQIVVTTTLAASPSMTFKMESLKSRCLLSRPATARSPSARKSADADLVPDAIAVLQRKIEDLGCGCRIETKQTDNPVSHHESDLHALRMMRKMAGKYRLPPPAGSPAARYTSRDSKPPRPCGDPARFVGAYRTPQRSPRAPLDRS